MMDRRLDKDHRRPLVALGRGSYNIKIYGGKLMLSSGRLAAVNSDDDYMAYIIYTRGKGNLTSVYVSKLKELNYLEHVKSY